jgi:hypothetical protein
MRRGFSELTQNFEAGRWIVTQPGADEGDVDVLWQRGIEDLFRGRDAGDDLEIGLMSERPLYEFSDECAWICEEN